MDNSNSSRSTTSRARDDKAGIKLKIPPHKTTRYKEKFQAMREKYDRVTAAHEAYERDLNIAAVKMKELQDENDLLLDAINIAEPDITRILSSLQHETIPPPESRPDNGASISSRVQHLPLQSPHMNGNSGARHSNGGMNS